LDSAELTEWEAFAEVEPLGQAREDLRHAHLCAVLATLKGVKDAKVSEFLDLFDFWKPLPTPESEEEALLRRRRALKAAFRQMMADQKFIAEENARLGYVQQT
jgi:hypothetical protein